MKTCNFCGAQLGDDVVFCPECGRNINEPNPQNNQYNYANSQNPNPQNSQYNYGNFQNPNPQYNIPAQPLADAQDVKKNKVFAIAPYLLGAVGTIVAVLAAKDSEFVMFHVKEAIKNDILAVITAVITTLLFWTVIAPIVGGIFAIALLVVRVIGAVNASKGLLKPAPISGKVKFLN